MSEILTKPQERALQAFRIDGEAFDGSVWDEGVRPWPTMDNLVAKGLVERVQWWGGEEGWEYVLTAKGHEHIGPTDFERRAAEAANSQASTEQ